jgi:hypothetical protein
MVCGRFWSYSAQDTIGKVDAPDEYRQLAEHLRSQRFWDLQIELDTKRGPEDEPPVQKIYTIAGKNMVADDVVNRVAKIRRHFLEDSIGSNVKFPPPGRPRVVEPINYEFS